MKYYLIKANEEIPHADMPYVELTKEDIERLIIANCGLPNDIELNHKLRKVLE